VARGTRSQLQAKIFHAFSTQARTHQYHLGFRHASTDSVTRNPVCPRLELQAEAHGKRLSIYPGQMRWSEFRRVPYRTASQVSAIISRGYPGQPARDEGMNAMFPSRTPTP
jgi:hypothetical protein